MATSRGFLEESVVYRSLRSVGAPSIRSLDETVVRDARLYRMVVCWYRGVQESAIVRTFDNPSLQAIALFAIVCLSLIRIFTAGLHVTVRFLSFALVAVVLVVLTWRFTQPLAKSTVPSGDRGARDGQ